MSTRDEVDMPKLSTVHIMHILGRSHSAKQLSIIGVLGSTRVRLILIIPRTVKSSCTFVVPTTTH